MNGRTKRTNKIIERIKEAAFRLFSMKAVDSVTMDEIAGQAGVSKVTIYKHFHSKEDLLQDVLALYSDRVFSAVEAVLNSDLDFLEKLRIILLSQADRPRMASGDHLFALLERDAQTGGMLKARLKNILFRFFEQGKQQGHIDPDIPFEILYLHAEIYRAGYKAMLAEVETVAPDLESREKMNRLFFWGLLKPAG